MLGSTLRRLGRVKLLAAYVVAMWTCFLSIWLWPDFTVGFLAPVTNRELGAIEVVQTVSLVAMILLSACEAARPNRTGAQRVLWCCVAAAVAFVLAEETDYGLHYFDFITDRPAFTSTIGDSWRNLHNQGSNGVTFKALAIVPAIVLFVVFPLATTRSRQLGFDRAHAYYLLLVFVSFATMLILSRSERSPVSRELVDQSQVLWELVELGLYVLLWTFLSDWANRVYRGSSAIESDGATQSVRPRGVD